MKTIIVLLAVVLLSGCFYQTVDSRDIRNAIKFCGSVEEVAEISADFLGGEMVLCFDNARHSRLGHVQ